MTLNEIRVWMPINGVLVRRGSSSGLADQPPSSPYATVNSGQDPVAALASAPTGATILINDGVYPLTSPLAPKQGQYIYCTDGVVFDGSRTLTGWTSDGSGHWYASGYLPAAYSDGGVCDVISGTESQQCRQREDVYRDSSPLNRYMVLADLATGGFFADYAANRVYVADDPTGHAFKMCRTQYAMNSSVSGVTWRGGTFQYFATPSSTGAVTVSGGSNWTIRKSVFQWNHAHGLFADSTSGLLVQHIRSCYNQQLGFGHHAGTGSVIEDSEFDHNNSQKMYYQADWESGGFKATFSTDCTIRRCHSHDNQGVGLWWDIDNVNWTIGGAPGDGNLVEYNFADGMRWEISFCADISYNTFQYNGFGMAYDGARGSDFSLLAVAGVNINSSSGTDPRTGAGPGLNIHHNTVTNNENGVGLQMRSRGNSGTYPSYARDLNNVRTYGNTITQQTYSYVDPAAGTHKAGLDHGFGEGVSGIRCLSPVDPSKYGSLANNTFHDNTYVLGDPVNGTTQSGAARFSGWNGTSQTYMSFANWKALAGMDTSGSTMSSTTG